jgi:hypothetical protein
MSPPPDDAKRVLTLELDAFAAQAIETEAEQLGVAVDELASFAVLYYLADHDSGRIARALPDSLTRTAPVTFGKAPVR